MKWVQRDEFSYEFVWDGDKRKGIDPTNSSFRRLKMKASSFYVCDMCKKDNVCKIKGIICADCAHAQKDEKPNEIIRFKKFKDATALGHDKETGRPIAIDSRGRKFDSSETIYEQTPNDPYGWKATGKRVRDK